MIKNGIRTFFLLCVLSFIFTYIQIFIGFFLNVLIFIPYEGRIAISTGSAVVLYYVSLFLLSKTKGYNLTGKFDFDPLQQIVGSVIGIAIYGIISALLISAPSGLQRLLTYFYSVGVMAYSFMCNCFSLAENTHSLSYISVLIQLPLIIFIRIFGLFIGKSIKIEECPALGQKNTQEEETVIVPHNNYL